MSERRAAPRLPLTVPAILYSGRGEIRCRIHDLSRYGVAVATPPGGIPRGMLRIRFALTEDSPSVLCDCIPVHDSPGRGDVWGFKFLDPERDLPAHVTVHLPEAIAEVPAPEAVPLQPHDGGALPGPSAQPPCRDGSEGAPEPSAPSREDLDRELQVLYRRALESMKSRSGRERR